MVTTKTRSSACCCVPFLRLWYQPSTTISFVLLVPKNLLLCFPFSLLVVIIFACIHFLQVLCSFASRLLIQLVCPHGLLCAFWNSISVSPIAVICLLLFNSLTECKTSSFFNVGLKTFVAWVTWWCGEVKCPSKHDSDNLGLLLHSTMIWITGDGCSTTCRVAYTCRLDQVHPNPPAKTMLLCGLCLCGLCLCGLCLCGD